MKQIRNGLTLAVISIFTYMGTGLAETVSGINELYAEEERPQEYCLALNMYFESRGSSVADMAGVSDVVLNRVKDARYPNTICEVIKQGPVRESWKTKKDPDLLDHERVYNPVRNKCQFSWYCDGKKDELINYEDNIKLKVAQDIAYQILAFNKWAGMIEGATHYHADYVSPTWRKQMRLIGKIDAHIFYRWD